MNQTEMINKILNVKNGTIDHEIFDKKRPPEEFGDAVKLFYNQVEHTFTAVVFDPETKNVFSEKTLPDTDSAFSFISATLDGIKYTDDKKNPNETEYVNIYWDEWRN